MPSCQKPCWKVMVQLPSMLKSSSTTDIFAKHAWDQSSMSTNICVLLETFYNPEFLIVST